jgi:hypothetical protein
MENPDDIAEALDVVNCAKYFNEIEVGEAYLCPTDKSAYSHKPCRFFGLYRNKRVERVADIEAVVDVAKPSGEGVPLKAEVLWSNTGKSDQQLQQTAIEKALRFRANELPIRVFILANITPTDFVKDSKGGMYESKRYFDVSRLKAKDTGDLAAKLEGKQWSDLKPYRWE